MKIAIIGAGVIGTSLGLALKSAKVDARIVGSDERYSEANKGKKQHAFDKIERSLMSTVEGADIVVLAMPVMSMKEIMEVIGPELPQGCIVTDTGSTKEQVLLWAEQYLPVGVNFVGGHPLVWPVGSGPQYATEDMFKGRGWCLIPGKNASQEAVDKVVKLVQLVGARPVFLTADEHDSYAAGVSQLPVVLSAALMKCTSKSPTWADISRLAEPSFAHFTVYAANNPDVNKDICLTNSARTVEWIDRFIGELIAVRESLLKEREKADETLHQFFDSALEERLRWTTGHIRQGPELAMQTPTMSDMMMELVIPRKFIEMYRRGMKRAEKTEEGEKPAPDTSPQDKKQ
jgi:prephenate dehydrogenase